MASPKAGTGTSDIVIDPSDIVIETSAAKSGDGNVAQALVHVMLSSANAAIDPVYVDHSYKIAERDALIYVAINQSLNFVVQRPFPLLKYPNAHKDTNFNRWTLRSRWQWGYLSRKQIRPMLFRERKPVFQFGTCRVVSEDGKRGSASTTNASCLGSTYGNCCSVKGNCGGTAAFCSLVNLCQPSFGTCTA
ncbi:hypothetical protein BKA61DRAFT_567771 [Leptodontidium sp. MPI-SDFR-AT-0119]|nr:hypothetical protein BKA61DRAFT_567771 [Leptodontidium sp. MPI-SDFR-AT-0119]